MKRELSDYDYIGIEPCGCITAACVDRGDKWTAKFVTDMIKDGLRVERVHRTYLESHPLVWDCPHRKQEIMQLPLWDDSVTPPPSQNSGEV